MGFPAGSLKMEMMVETTQAITNAAGRNPLRSFVEAAGGRCIAMHFGTYDYTASCGITAEYQQMDHPLTNRMLIVSKDGVSEYCP